MSAAPPAGLPMALPPVDNTMGALLIGVLVAGCLYGVSCVQVWYYYRHYNEYDGMFTKSLVFCTWATDTVHQILISHTVYIYLVTNYGNPLELNNIVWSIIAEVFFNAFTAFFVQSFFVNRIWNLSKKNIPLTGFLAAMVLGNLAVTLAYSIKATQLVPQTWDQAPRVRGLSISINAMNASCDVFIAACCVFLLQSSRTGFSESNSMITKLMVFTVNTGLLTSLCATASLVAVVSSPLSFIYVCFYFVLGRLYSNSLMATLNARRGMQRKGDSYSVPSLGTTGRARTQYGQTTDNGVQLSVRVDTSRDVGGGQVDDGFYKSDQKGRTFVDV